MGLWDREHQDKGKVVNPKRQPAAALAAGAGQALDRDSHEMVSCG